MTKDQNIESFFSAVEITGLEMLKGNLNPRSLVAVATSFDKQEKGAKVFIEERYCPSEGRAQIEMLKQSITDQDAIYALESTQQKIISTCHK